MKKPKELHYKRASIEGRNGTLQQAVETALKHLKLPKDRLEKLGADGEEGRVLLYPRHTKKVLCLILTTYVQGAEQAIMGIAPDQADWPIRQVKPPPLKGTKDTEFLDGYLYVGIWGSHVVFLPTRSCGSEALETHLNWLLRQAGSLPDRAMVSLNDRPPQALRDREFKRVQAFKLNAPLQIGYRQSGSEEATNHLLQIRPRGGAWDAIKDLIKQIGGDFPEDIVLDDLNPDDVHVTLQVTCRKRGLERSGPLLDILANSLRHVTSEVVQFEFDDGTKLKGTDLKTRTSIRVECAGNLPVPTEVDKAIHEYLMKLVDEEIIEADA